jgi:hypothetical protein
VTRLCQSIADIDNRLQQKRFKIDYQYIYLNRLRFLLLPSCTAMYANCVPTQKSIPTVKLKRFWCNQVSFLAYQLKNGEIVLSENQIILSANRNIKKIVKNFISSNNLKTIKATLPNRSNSIVYPISTVTALWSNLNSTQQLPSREQQLLAGFLSNSPIQEGSKYNADGGKNAKTEVTDTDLRMIALPVSIKLTKKIEIQVLVLHNNYYIEIYEGLSKLGTQPTWFEELHDSERRKKILRQKGFSGEIKTIDYQEDNKVWRVQAFSVLDWINICDYLATKGNTKAIDVLKSLAILNLDRRVKTTFCPNVVATAMLSSSLKN